MVLSAPPVALTRRTQQQRREATIARLVDATIEAIAEVGYARCSLGEICERSGVSRGGLFRHFDSRLDLVVAAAEEVGRRQLRQAEERFADVDIDPVEVLRYTRDQARQPIRAVWFELLVAARTDDELRQRLHAVTAATLNAVETSSAPLGQVLGLSPDNMHVVVTSVVHMFEAEAIFSATYPRPGLEEQRLELLADALRSLAKDTH